MMTRSTLGRVLLGTALASALAAGWTQTARAAGLQVSPAIIDFAAKKSGDLLPPITVNNPTKDEVEVTISFGTIAHDPMGGPQLDIKGYKYATPEAFSVKQPKFKLAPGASKAIEVQVKYPAGRAGGVYAAMYLLAAPVKKAQTTLQVQVRMAVVLEVALPGEAKHALAPVTVFGRQDGAGAPISVFAQVRNDGTVHEKASGVAVITNAKGQQVAKIPLIEVNVFPGLVRAVQGSWKAPSNLPPGTYKVAADITNKSSPVKVAGELKFVKPGELAVERIIITKFAPEPVVQKKPIAFEAAISNAGNVSFAPVGVVVLLNGKGNEAARIPVTGTTVAPGAKVTLKGSFAAGLLPGRYEGHLAITGGHAVDLAGRDFALQVLEKDPNVSAKIVKFDPPKGDKPFYTLEVKNDGNADLEAEGVVMVADTGGNVVAQVILDKRAVAMGKSVEYLQGLPELEPGLYELRAFVKFGGKSPATRTIKHFVQ